MKIFKLKNEESIPVNYHDFSTHNREYIKNENEYALSKECARTAPIDAYNSALSNCYYPLKPVSRMFKIIANND